MMKYTFILFACVGLLACAVGADPDSPSEDGIDILLPPDLPLCFPVIYPDGSVIHTGAGCDL